MKQFLFFVLLISYKSTRSQCSVQITLSQTDCFQINNNIVAVNASGQPPFTYLWYNGDTTSMSDSIPFGDTVSVTIMDNLGCIASDIGVLPNFNAFFNCYTQVVNNASCMSGWSICCDGSMVVHALDSLSLCPVDQYIVGGGFIGNCTGSTTQTYYTDTIINLAQATYTITPMSSCGCPYYSTSFTMPGNAATGVDDSTLGTNWKINPNPSNGGITIDCGPLWSQNSQLTELLIYSAEGKLILKTIVESQTSTFKFEELENGIYYCALISQGLPISTRRLIIIK
ncbi:MAG: hypothetical protein K0S33_2158 [Bacteroidetes bacterium]|jgi:hypothetical protein|nr:hypothetical protein [Bacteroidota bacterium]